MKKRGLIFWLSGALAAAAMAAAVNAPAEVLNNLDFFSDFELLANLEILEDEPAENGPVAVSTSTAVSTAPAVSTDSAGAGISTETIKISDPSGRSYEKH